MIFVKLIFWVTTVNAILYVTANWCKVEWSVGKTTRRGSCTTHSISVSVPRYKGSFCYLLL